MSFMESEAFKKHWKLWHRQLFQSVRQHGQTVGIISENSPASQRPWPSWWESERCAVLNKLANKEVYLVPPNSDTLLTGKTQTGMRCRWLLLTKGNFFSNLNDSLGNCCVSDSCRCICTALSFHSLSCCAPVSQQSTSTGVLLQGYLRFSKCREGIYPQWYTQINKIKKKTLSL